MFSKITLPAALAATLAFGSLPATAAMQPQESPADLGAFRTAKVSLEQAVKTVQAQTGGTVISAIFHTTPVVGPKPAYSAADVTGRVEGYLVTFVTAGTMNVCYVDPQTGSAFQVATAGTADDTLRVSDRPDDLSQAIALAEQRTGGHAIEAMPERHGGTFGYRIGVVRNGTINNEWVNPGAGQVISGL